MSRELVSVPDVVAVAQAQLAIINNSLKEARTEQDLTAAIQGLEAAVRFMRFATGTPPVDGESSPKANEDTSSATAAKSIRTPFGVEMARLRALRGLRPSESSIAMGRRSSYMSQLERGEYSAKDVDLDQVQRCLGLSDREVGGLKLLQSLMGSNPKPSTVRSLRDKPKLLDALAEYLGHAERLVIGAPRVSLSNGPFHLPEPSDADPGATTLIGLLRASTSPLDQRRALALTDGMANVPGFVVVIDHLVAAMAVAGDVMVLFFPDQVRTLSAQLSKAVFRGDV